ncbi:hypothetical protein BCR34DRAFT_667501 [Clohesyomyces aquaticus]|uniref:Ankyrin repeat-containing domain protein n=1 Tax=Clohesyomyces aquaticus TaxID=1231657 RepID=A0A1Y1YYM5_9PLEO|nr:hypothetical protein BCR34DRAFT_667501 [Clohesyomyces aquaticus]
MDSARPMLLFQPQLLCLFTTSQAPLSAFRSTSTSKLAQNVTPRTPLGSGPRNSHQSRANLGPTSRLQHASREPLQEVSLIRRYSGLYLKPAPPSFIRHVLQLCLDNTPWSNGILMTRIRRVGQDLQRRLYQPTQSETPKPPDRDADIEPELSPEVWEYIFHALTVHSKVDTLFDFLDPSRHMEEGTQMDVEASVVDVAIANGLSQVYSNIPSPKWGKTMMYFFGNPLVVASRRADTEAFKYLLECGEHWMGLYDPDSHALVLAARTGCKEIMDMIIDPRWQLSAESMNRDAAIWEALYRRDVTMALQILTWAEPEKEMATYGLDERASKSICSWGIANGEFEIVRNTIRHPSGRIMRHVVERALLDAVDVRNWEMFDKIRGEVDTISKPMLKKVVYHVLAQRDQREDIRALEQRALEWRLYMNAASAVVAAAHGGRIHLLEGLMCRDNQAHDPGDDKLAERQRYLAFLVAISNNQLEAMEWMLTNWGLDPDIGDPYPRDKEEHYPTELDIRPLMVAIDSGHAAAVDLLIRRRATPLSDTTATREFSRSYRFQGRRQNFGRLFEELGMEQCLEGIFEFPDGLKNGYLNAIETDHLHPDDRIWYKFPNQRLWEDWRKARLDEAIDKAVAGGHEVPCACDGGHDGPLQSGAYSHSVRRTDY